MAQPLSNSASPAKPVEEPELGEPVKREKKSKVAAQSQINFNFDHFRMDSKKYKKERPKSKYKVQNKFNQRKQSANPAQKGVSKALASLIPYFGYKPNGRMMAAVA